MHRIMTLHPEEQLFTVSCHNFKYLEARLK